MHATLGGESCCARDAVPL